MNQFPQGQRKRVFRGISPLRPRDLAQRYGSLRAGYGRQISGQAVQGAVGEDGEGDGFLGIYREAEAVRKLHAEPGEQLAQPVDNQVIVCSPP